MEIQTIPGSGFRDAGYNSRLMGNVLIQDPQPQSQTYDLRQIVRLIRRRLSLVIAVALLGTALTAFVALFLLPSYTAKALLIVGQDGGAEATQPSDALVDTQITAITSDANLNQVLVSLSHDPRLKAAAPRLQDLQQRLKVMQELRSRLIAVTFTARSPDAAAAIANRIVTVYMSGLTQQQSQYEASAIARVTKERASLEQQIAQTQNELNAATAPAAKADLDARLLELQRRLDANRVYGNLIQSREDEIRQQEAISPAVRIYSLAMPPEQPSSTRPILIVLPALIGWLLWGAALAFLVGRFTNRVRCEDEVVEAFGVPCLGATPRARRIRKCGPFDFISLAPRTAYAEAIRSIVITNLLMDSGRRTTVLVTSSVHGEGKTTFASSFAAYASQVRGRVLLLDLDFTRKKGHYGVSSAAPGLFEVLRSECSLHDAVQPVGRVNLHHLPLGHGPEDPLPLIASERMALLMRQLRETYDCIVINGPPVLDISEARVIAGMADRLLFVVRKGRTRRTQALESLETVTSLGEPRYQIESQSLSGVILTYAADKLHPRRNVPMVRPRLRLAAQTRRKSSPAARAIVDRPVEGTSGAPRAIAGTGVNP